MSESTDSAESAKIDLSGFISAGILDVKIGLKLAPVFFVDAQTYYGEREDAPKEKPLQFGHWCHLWTDDGFENELTAFAGTLGLRAEYGQRGGSMRKYHFDLRPSKRRLALLGGAVIRSLEDWIESTMTSIHPARSMRLPADGRIYQLPRAQGERTVLKVFSGSVYAALGSGISLIDTCLPNTIKDYGTAKDDHEPLQLRAGSKGAVIEVTQRKGGLR